MSRCGASAVLAKNRNRAHHRLDLAADTWSCSGHHCRIEITRKQRNERLRLYRDPGVRRVPRREFSALLHRHVERCGVVFWRCEVPRTARIVLPGL